jgi:hypothetical protein
LKKKLEIEPIEWDDERPRGRINDGRRTWRERGELGDPRDALDEPRERRDFRDRRPAPAQADPFFDRPYEAPESEAAPAWESTKPAVSASRISANIKTKRKVAALFKSPA